MEDLVARLRSTDYGLPDDGPILSEAANEIDLLRGLVLRQLRWQKHRNSVGIVMGPEEYAWIADADETIAGQRRANQRPARASKDVTMTENTNTENEGTGGPSALSAGLGAYPACKGTNCGCTDGRSHSQECKQEYDDAFSGVLGLCSVPMWADGCPAGTCDCKAYGERPKGATFWNYAANEEQRLDGRYNGYVPGLACPAHGGPKAPNARNEGAEPLLAKLPLD